MNFSFFGFEVFRQCAKAISKGSWYGYLLLICMLVLIAGAMLQWSSVILLGLLIVIFVLIYIVNLIER